MGEHSPVLRLAMVNFAYRASHLPSLSPALGYLVLTSSITHLPAVRRKAIEKVWVGGDLSTALLCSGNLLYSSGRIRGGQCCCVRNGLSLACAHLLRPDLVTVVMEQAMCLPSQPLPCKDR